MCGQNGAHISAPFSDCGQVRVVAGKEPVVRRFSNTSTASSVSYGSGVTTSCSSSFEESSLTNQLCPVSEITKAFQNEECCAHGRGAACEVHAGQLPLKPTTPPSLLSSLDTRSRKLAISRTGGVTSPPPPVLQTAKIQYMESTKAVALLSAMDVDDVDEPFVMSLDGNYDNFVELETTSSPAAVVGQGFGMFVQQADELGTFARTRSMSASTDHSVEASPERVRSGKLRKESWSERTEKEETLMFELEV